MRVFDGSSGGFSVVFKQKDVAEAAVVLQIQHAIAIGPKHFLDCLVVDGRKRGFVIRRFDDHFVRPDAVHAVEEAFAFPIQTTFDTESGKFVGHHAKRPSRRVFAAAVAAISENFGWSLSFIAGAERTVRITLDLNALSDKIHGAFRAVGRDDDPTSRNRIFAKLRQIFLLGLSGSHEYFSSPNAALWRRTDGF